VCTPSAVVREDGDEEHLSSVDRLASAARKILGFSSYGGGELVMVVVPRDKCVGEVNVRR
jgi:hypothetical protein